MFSRNETILGIESTFFVELSHCSLVIANMGLQKLKLLETPSHFKENVSTKSFELTRAFFNSFSLIQQHPIVMNVSFRDSIKQSSGSSSKYCGRLIFSKSILGDAFLLVLSISSPISRKERPSFTPSVSSLSFIVASKGISGQRGNRGDSVYQMSSFRLFLK